MKNAANPRSNQFAAPVFEYAPQRPMSNEFRQPAFEYAPSYFKPTPEAKAEVEELMFLAVETDELIDAYLYQRHLVELCKKSEDELVDVSLATEEQYLPLKKAAEAYADTQKELDNLQWGKRKFLEKHDGFIDLKKYRKAWIRKHGRLRSWTQAVEMVGDRDTNAFDLALYLDAISRCKARASRLTRQLRILGEQAKGKSDSPIADLYC